LKVGDCGRGAHVDLREDRTEAITNPPVRRATGPARTVPRDTSGTPAFDKRERDEQAFVDAVSEWPTG
jgi:hypothetical protein